MYFRVYILIPLCFLTQKVIYYTLDSTNIFYISTWAISLPVSSWYNKYKDFLCKLLGPSYSSDSLIQELFSYSIKLLGIPKQVRGEVPGMEKYNIKNGQRNRKEPRKDITVVAVRIERKRQILITNTRLDMGSEIVRKSKITPGELE